MNRRALTIRLELAFGALERQAAQRPQTGSYRSTLNSLSRARCYNVVDLVNHLDAEALADGD